MDRAAAEKAILSIFNLYRTLRPGDARLLQKLNDGKLYEMFVLSELVGNLRARRFKLKFIGTTLKFKGAPGQIKKSDPHFEITAPDGSPLWLFVDIEFETLGSSSAGFHDLSRHHELDIAVVTATPPNPSYSQIALAIECKCVANFEKKLIKEALGIRRELSLVHQDQDSILSQCGGNPIVKVRANPASEFWLAHIDAAGSNYSSSPSFFGVELRHLEP